MSEQEYIPIIDNVETKPETIQQENTQQKNDAYVIHPQSEMNQNLQYCVMYQPVFVSPQDSNIYFAGNLLAKLPEIQDKKFLQSLSETFTIAEKSINKTMTPFIHKVEKMTGHAVDILQEKINKVVKDIKDKKAKRQNNVPLESYNSKTQIQPGESLIEEEEPLIDLNTDVNEEFITHRKINNEKPLDF